MPGKLKKFLSHLINSVANLVPCNCLLCGTENPELLCADCQMQFFSTSPNRCTCCALKLANDDKRCGRCLSDPPAFHSTTVACDYVAPLDQLILALKFEHQLAAAPVLADLLRKAVLSQGLKQHILPEILMPVPLGRSRLAERGFNQAAEIAKPLARLLDLPVYPQLLHRVRDTAAQTLLHPDQRAQNIKHAFSPNPLHSDKIQGRHIGVVDDVMTTGATLDEIAACLKRHGAARVSNFVFARTPPH